MGEGGEGGKGGRVGNEGEGGGMERRTWDGERGRDRKKDMGRRGRRRGRNEKNQYKEGRTGGGGDKEFK